jgi:hypothetical protein
MGKRMKDGRALMTVSPSTADILEGITDLSEWDDEELLRGQRKASNGKFVGRPPKVVPQEVHAERVRRTMSKAYALLHESTVDAVALLRTVVLDDFANYSDRIRAAELIMTRVLGKPTERIELATERPDPPWMVAIRHGIVGLVTEPEDSEIVDAEIVEEEVLWE